MLELFHSFYFFNLQGEICIQYFTTIHRVRRLHVGFLNAKNPLLGVMAFSARCETHSTLDLVESWLPCFPQAVGPNPFPKLAPFYPIYPHMWHNFKLAEEDIDISEVFFIQYHIYWTTRSPATLPEIYIFVVPSPSVDPILPVCLIHRCSNKFGCMHMCL